MVLLRDEADANAMIHVFKLNMPMHLCGPVLSNTPIVVLTDFTDEAADHADVHGQD